MGGSDDRLTEVLDGYGASLREKGLVLAKHQPYLVRWVRDFLLFARGHGGYTFEQTQDMFLAEIGSALGPSPPNTCPDTTESIAKPET